MGQRLTGQWRAEGCKGSERRWGVAEVRQALPDGAVEAGRVLGGLGERGSPQCCNPVNAAHSPDWRHSPHHREESGVCR